MPEHEAQWSVLWTHSNRERRVEEQLRGKGFETFLPMVNAWSRRRGAQLSTPIPMFRGYVFVRHIVDKRSHLALLTARGVVKVLGDRWDCPAPVADEEIEAIRRMAAADVPIFPYPFLTEGQQVRIDAGALVGVEGILIATKPQKGLVVVSVDLLQRSVAVAVELTQISPVSHTGMAGRAAHLARPVFARGPA